MCQRINLDSAETLEALKRGDSWAWEALYTQLWDPIVRLCRLTLWNRVRDLDQVAQDIAEETLSRFFERRSQFKANSCVKTYVIKLAKNEIIDYIEETAKSSLLKVKALEDGIGEVLQRMTPEQLLEKQEFEMKVKTAVEELSERKRSIITDHFYNGMKQREIAEAQGLNVKAIGSYISRGIKDLRKVLAPLR